MEAVIFVGIQGAGKSSFYKERFFDTHVRINLDMLKTKHRQRVLLAACVEAGQPFVVDNTNVTPETRALFIAPARAAGFRVVGYYFLTDVPSALARNGLRQGAARVPDQAIYGTQKRLVAPTPAEGFDALFRVRAGAAGGFLVEAWPDEV
ncbi:MAG: AAA family ATPase [Acidobacteria bacterium]|nr:AAA family ATPase [Acidobacteriota bacterium]